MRGRSTDLQMEGAALAGAGQRDRPRKGGKRTKASKAQELFEEEVKRLAVELVDVKLSLKSLRNVVEYEEALKSALASPRPCGVDMAMDHWFRPLRPRRNPRHETLVAEGACPVISNSLVERPPGPPWLVWTPEWVPRRWS